MGKHIGYNRYGNRLYDDGGVVRIFPGERLAQMYGGRFPEDALDVWNRTIYDNPFGVDESRVRTLRFTYRSYEGYDLELCVDLPSEGSGFLVLFHIFGGGWTSGFPERVEVISKYFASRGIAGVRVGHSLSSHPGATIGRAFDDLDSARRYVFARTVEYTLDTTRFGYVGGSSGAHLSAVAALTTPPRDKSPGGLRRSLRLQYVRGRRQALFRAQYPGVQAGDLPGFDDACFGACRVSRPRTGRPPRGVCPEHQFRGVGRSPRAEGRTAPLSLLLAPVQPSRNNGYVP